MMSPAPDVLVISQKNHYVKEQNSFLTCLLDRSCGKVLNAMVKMNFFVAMTPVWFSFSLYLVYSPDHVIKQQNTKIWEYKYLLQCSYFPLTDIPRSSDRVLYPVPIPKSESECVIFFNQRSSERMPAKEKRIREMSREQSSRVGEPEQNIDRRTESFKRSILPQSWLICRMLDKISRPKTIFL